MITRETFEQTLRSFLKREPFQPFGIEMDDGRRFFVGDRDAVFYHQGGTAMYFHRDGEMDFVDAEGVRRFIELVEKASA